MLYEDSGMPNTKRPITKLRPLPNGRELVICTFLNVHNLNNINPNWAIALFGFRILGFGNWMIVPFQNFWRRSPIHLSEHLTRNLVVYCIFIIQLFLEKQLRLVILGKGMLVLARLCYVVLSQVRLAKDLKNPIATQ